VTNDSLTIALQTSSGAAAVSSGTTTVALVSQTPSGYFASTNGSTSNTTTATFANGVGTVTVYFGDTVAESDTVTAQSAGLTSANTTLHTVAAAASKVSMTATTSVVASATTNDAVTLAIQDQYGNAVTPTGSTTLNLTSTAPGFFTAASGGSSTAAITTVTLAAGTGQKTVYFGDMTAQTATLSSTGGLSGSTSVTVTPGPASKVGVTPSATTSAASSSSNDPVVISLQDQFGNTVTPTVATPVTLASTAPGFFTAANGTNGTTSSITTATINANTSSKTVYFGDPTAQTATLTLSSAGLTSGAAQIRVSSAGPSQLGVAAQSSTLTATSVGTDAVTLTLQDVNGNTVTATAAVNITLQDSGGGFYTATKNSGTQISTASIPTGSSSVTVYFGDTNAETTTLQAGGTYSGTSTVTVNAAAPTQVVLIPTTTNPGRNNRASDLITIQAEDQFGNPTATAPSSSYTLTTSTGNGFFSTTYNSYGGSSSVAISLNGANNGQSSIYFGDSTNKDNPSIQLYDANNRLVASVAVTA
jgi:hypothetical protein